MGVNEVSWGRLPVTKESKVNGFNKIYWQFKLAVPCKMYVLF